MEAALPWLMFVTLFLLLMSGMPVAFCLAGVGMVFGFIGSALDLFTIKQAFNPLPKRMFDGIVMSDMLQAVPLFVLMGLVLERSRMAEDLLDAMERILHRVRGGLAISVVLVGALMAAATGIVGATVVTMTVLALPSMLQRRYHRPLACGTIAASGTLGQIIPPSIVLILLGDQMSVSVGKLFQGAFIPGLLLVGAYLAYIGIRVLFQPQLAPTQAEQDQPATPLPWGTILLNFLPPIVLILLVLGSILIGAATPTEAAGCGAIGALVVAGCKKRLTWKAISGSLMETVKVTAMVFFILAGAQCFSLIFQKVDGDYAIRDLIESWQLGPGGFVIALMLLVFVLGFFLDFLEICFVIIPVVMPLTEHLGMTSTEDKVVLGILLALNLQTSFLTPPFGFSLFYLKGSAPAGITTGDIYRGVVPFIGIQLTVLALAWLWPDLVLWLPGVIGQ